MGDDQRVEIYLQPGNRDRVSVWKGKYFNGNTALQLVCEEFDGQPSDWLAGELYGAATVNLMVVDPLKPLRAYLDVNNVPGILDALVAANAGVPTGIVTRSGWCEYPLFAFHEEWLATVPEIGR